MWYFFFELDFLLINYILLTEFSLCLFIFILFWKTGFTLAFIALCRPYFGTFDFDDAYASSYVSTFVFVTTYYWIAIVSMTVLSSAILIDGVRMHSEFEQLQRRGLPRKEGTYIDTKNAKWKALLIFKFLFLPFLKPVSLSLSHCHVYSILKTNQNRIHVFF